MTVDAGAPPEMACVESVPTGAERPTVAAKAPPYARAGALVPLEIVVRHATGERVTLPGDLPRLQAGEVRVADDGTFGKGAPPKAAAVPGDPSHETTALSVPFVVLSTSTPRKTFTLPSVRVVVLRRGGGEIVVCTPPQQVAIDQPIAEASDPQVRPNPPTRPQITRDERLQAIATWSLVALVVGAVGVAVVLYLRSRPKPAPPPPPPEPAWRIALAKIAAARAELERGELETKVYYDKVSDALREHLGATFGFDGLEMTTDEILARVSRVPSFSLPRADLGALLEACDLVKFAGLRPDREESLLLAQRAEKLVRATAGSLAFPPLVPRAEREDR